MRSLIDILGIVWFNRGMLTGRVLIGIFRVIWGRLSLNPPLRCPYKCFDNWFIVRSLIDILGIGWFNRGMPKGRVLMGIFG
ncbi:MAG: hypothetical protein F6K41_31075 [Symploca sp. SIO3E6]|nr:hypothetical protein [Caldora sp. SIO3E6]